MESGKNGSKSPYPPYNNSVKYYTDPFEAVGAEYGLEDQETAKELAEKKDADAPDEPVESWGWINNVD